MQTLKEDVVESGGVIYKIGYLTKDELKTYCYRCGKPMLLGKEEFEPGHWKDIIEQRAFFVGRCPTDCELIDARNMAVSIGGETNTVTIGFSRLRKMADDYRHNEITTRKVVH